MSAVMAISACSIPAGSSATDVPMTMTARTSALSQAGHQLTPAQLKAALLRKADLPGYGPYKIVNDQPTSSNKPRCLKTLNYLELDPFTAVPGAYQAETAYARSTKDGPWLEEIIRSYPGQGAASALRSIRAYLANCGSFTVSWTTPAASATETVRGLGSAGFGDQSWSARLTVSGSSIFKTIENLDIIRVGTSLIILAHVAAFYPPGQAATKSIAKVATTRLRAE